MAVQGYSSVQIRLHWAVMILVVLQYLLHKGIVAGFRTKVDTGMVTFTGLTVAHIAGGLLILLLALWRLSLRRSLGVPPPPAGDPAWQTAVAKATHAAIYACLLALPLTGFIAWAGPFPLSGGIHSALRLLLLALVGLHVLGAVFGQFVRRSGVIGRMVKPD